MKVVVQLGYFIPFFKHWAYPVILYYRYAVYPFDPLSPVVLPLRS
jgi:hypothetical protein